VTSGSDPWPISSPPIPVYMEPHTRDAPKWTEEVLPKLGWGGVLQKINYATARVLSLLGGGGAEASPPPQGGGQRGAPPRRCTGRRPYLRDLSNLSYRYNLGITL